jgi:hypothetical protein
MKTNLIIVIWVICSSASLKSQETASSDTEFAGPIESYKLTFHRSVKLPDFILTFKQPQIALTGGYTLSDDKMAKYNYSNLSIYYFNGRYYHSGKRFRNIGNSIIYNNGELTNEGKPLESIKHDQTDIEYLQGENTGATKPFVGQRDWSNYTFKYKTQGLPISMNYTPMKDKQFYFSLFWISGEVKENHLYVFNRKIAKIDKELFLDFSSDQLFIDDKIIGKISELIK